MTSDDEEPHPPSTPPAPTDGEEHEGPPLLHAPPNKRRRFSIKGRMAILRNIERHMVTHGMTHHEACYEVNIHPSMHLRWMKQHDSMEAHRNYGARSVCIGRPSCLEACKDDLLRFIFENREQGMAVSVTMVMRKARQIFPEFAVKSRSAQYHSALRFVRSQGLVFRLGTNESQRSPAETAADALDYIINVARPKVVNQPGGTRISY